MVHVVFLLHCKLTLLNDILTEPNKKVQKKRDGFKKTS